MKVHEGVYCGLLLLAELFTTQRLLYGFLHVGIGCTKRTADDLKVVILWLPGSAGNLIGFIAYHAPADRRPIKIRKPGAQGILFVDDALLSRIVAPGIVCNRRGNRRGSAYACIFKRRGRTLLYCIRPSGNSSIIIILSSTSAIGSGISTWLL